MSLSEREERGEDLGGGCGCWEQLAPWCWDAHPQAVLLPGSGTAERWLLFSPRARLTGRPRLLKINLLLTKAACPVHFEVRRAMIFHLADSDFLKGSQTSQEARAQAAMPSLLLPNAIPGSHLVLLRAHFKTQPHQNNSSTCCLPICKPNCETAARQHNDICHPASQVEVRL